SLEAAESVGAGGDVSGSEVLDLLERLVDCSLVQTEPAADGAMRCRLLETVRQYAYNQLKGAAQAELTATHRRHAVYYCELAERGEAELIGPRQAVWFEHFEREHDNLRAALNWSIVSEGDADLGLRLGAALVRFWFIRGYLSEGNRWLDSVRNLQASTTSLNT